MRRWLYSVVWTIIWSLAYLALMRRGMVWAFGLAACMTASYGVLLWRTLGLLLGFGRPAPPVISHIHAPRHVRRLILEEERPWPPS